MRTDLINGKTLDEVTGMEAARFWGISKSAANRRLAKIREGRGPLSVSPAKKSSITMITGNRMECELPRTRINSLEELVKQFQVDLAIWEVERFICNSWEVGAKIDDRIVTSPLYQVKATFIKRNGWGAETVKKEIDRLVAEASGKIRKFNSVKGKIFAAADPLMAEIAIVDHHFGSLAWKPETGHANYDHRIAARLYEEAFMDLLERCAKGNRLDRIVIIHGNDAININGSSGATAAGTPQVNDTRWQHMWESYWECSVKAINSALEVAPVDVIVMPGNHDRDLIWAHGHSLKCFYSGRKDVRIDNAPICRKYYKYGVNLLGLAHGDSIKLNHLPLLMATEAADLYATCKRFEWHTGHLHHLRVDKDGENCGIRVRTLPSLSAPTQWAVTNGYSRSLRASQAFLWHRDKGLLDVKEHSVDFDYEG